MLKFISIRLVSVGVLFCIHRFRPTRPVDRLAAWRRAASRRHAATPHDPVRRVAFFTNSRRRSLPARSDPTRGHPIATQILAEEPNSPLDLLSIQGDILIGLQKDAERFIFFEIADVDAFRLALRKLFPGYLGRRRCGARAILDLAKAAGSHERLALLGLNLGFTYGGLGKLLDEPGFADGIADFDPSFKAGASEMGATRPQRGHEHFGFLDGVSQPGIRGLTEPVNPVDPEQGLPGQDLIHAGEFVFGYPGQVDPFKVGRPATKEEEGDIVAPPFDWMANGSFMVFRRLEQKVIAFHDFVETQAFALGTDPALLSARMVGRWPSGAPVERAPLQDDVGLAADRLSNNDLEFGEDIFQRRCPYAAHIRKAYPRDDLNDSGPALLAGKSGEASVQTHRLRRAGIPSAPRSARTR